MNLVVVVTLSALSNACVAVREPKLAIDGLRYHADTFAFICIPAMNDLVQSMVLAGGQWAGSAENLDGPDEIPTGKRRKDLGTMAFSTTAINFSTVNRAASLRSKQMPKSKGICSTTFVQMCSVCQKFIGLRLCY